nr:hypothetical protein Itr_chr15CG15040 [Ipomoea trifida]
MNPASSTSHLEQLSSPASNGSHWLPSWQLGPGGSKQLDQDNLAKKHRYTVQRHELADICMNTKRTPTISELCELENAPWQLESCYHALQEAQHEQQLSSPNLCLLLGFSLQAGQIHHC